MTYHFLVFVQLLLLIPRNRHCLDVWVQNVAEKIKEVEKCVVPGGTVDGVLLELVSCTNVVGGDARAATSQQKVSLWVFIFSHTGYI